MEGNVAEIRRDNLVFNYVEYDDYFALIYASASSAMAFK